jgi:hypothetical protein
MRRFAALLLALCCVALPAMVLPTTAQAAEDPIHLFVNGQEIVTDAPPVVENGRTLVPLRALTEPLGFMVGWDAVTQTVTLAKGDLFVVLTINKPVAVVDGMMVPLDVPPMVRDGRTLIPVRFVAEQLPGTRVKWDPVLRTVTVESLAPGGVPTPPVQEPTPPAQEPAPPVQEPTPPAQEPTPPAQENLTPVSKDDPSVLAQFQRIRQLPSSYYCKITWIEEVNDEVVGTTETDHWAQGENGLWLSVRAIGGLPELGIRTGAAIRNGRYWVLEPMSQWRETDNQSELAEAYKLEWLLTFGMSDLDIATKVMRGPNKLVVEWHLETAGDRDTIVLTATWGATGSLERVDQTSTSITSAGKFVTRRTFILSPLAGPIPYPAEIQ